MDYKEKVIALLNSKDLSKEQKEKLESIFPELKEESESERIRKELLSFCQNRADNYPNDPKYANIGNWIAWLEKQGKNADVILAEMRGEGKHKFKIGDIISNGEVVYRIDNIVKNAIGQDSYFLVNVEMEKNGNRYLIVTDSEGKTSHMGEITWLCEQVDESFEKQGEQKDILEDAILDSNEDGLIAETIRYKKEQNPIIDKVGTIFNVGDKIQYSKGCGTIMTIEKIENGEYIFSNNMGHTTIENGNKWYLVNTVEQKSAWSEEDERMYRGIHNLIYSTPYCNSRKEFSDWLKSLKERYTWKPSDEQLRQLELAIDYWKPNDTIVTTTLFKLWEDLKKLKG